MTRTAGPLANVISCRALVCPVRSGDGRGMGVLALAARSAGPGVHGRATAGWPRSSRAVRRSWSAGHYDALSGLYTRTAFEQRVRSIVAERTINGTPWSALYVNCDRLHVINDNHGMHVGDTVIGQLGELIRGRLPPGALAARISGDRFTVLLPTEVDDASRFAESLRVGAEMLSALHPGQDISISISIGVAPLENGRGGELAHSLAAAETACKAAKDRGRNRVATYQVADQSIIRRFSDIDVVTRVREALTHNRLRLVAQAIAPFNESAQKPPHFELLLRMIGRDGAALGPRHLHVGGGALPDDGRHRPLGRQARDRSCSSPMRTHCSPVRACSPSTSPASRSAMTSFRISCSTVCRRAASIRRSSASSSPKTRPFSTCRAPKW